MTAQPTPDMSELRAALEAAISQNRKELADYNVSLDLLDNPALPIPPALPRQYRDVVLVAREQMDCKACFGSKIDLEDYQSISPCPACNGKGITNKDGSIVQTTTQYKFKGGQGLADYVTWYKEANPQWACFINTEHIERTWGVWDSDEGGVYLRATIEPNDWIGYVPNEILAECFEIVKLQRNPHHPPHKHGSDNNGSEIEALA